VRKLRFDNSGIRTNFKDAADNSQGKFLLISRTYSCLDATNVRNMYSRLLLLLVISIFISSCSKFDENILPAPELSTYELSVIDYFKDIALGFDSGNASEVTRKWNRNMKIFVGGSPNSELLDELERIKNELNILFTDDFTIEIVNDSIDSNFYIFFGSANRYAAIIPEVSNFIGNNLGFYWVYFNSQNSLYKGSMYVDIFRASVIGQKRLLRVELTHAIGLGKHSPKYNDSIFQSAWTTNIEYAEIDRDLIRLLYHPSMYSGLYASQVEIVLTEILTTK